MCPILLAASGCSGGGPCGPTRATVAEVVDGDTLVLEGGERVRYLLVDTPESTGGKTDCYGVQSRDFNRQLVSGREVTLEYGEACRDRFDRLLAYVSVDGREVNSLLVERGYACVLFIPPAGEARQADFEALEAQARAEGRGVWSACSPVTCD